MAAAGHSIVKLNDDEILLILPKAKDDSETRTWIYSSGRDGWRRQEPGKLSLTDQVCGKIVVRQINFNYVLFILFINISIFQAGETSRVVCFGNNGTAAGAASFDPATGVWSVERDFPPAFGGAIAGGIAGGIARQEKSPRERKETLHLRGREKEKRKGEGEDEDSKLVFALNEKGGQRSFLIKDGADDNGRLMWEMLDFQLPGKALEIFEMVYIFKRNK